MIAPAAFSLLSFSGLRATSTTSLAGTRPRRCLRVLPPRPPEAGKMPSLCAIADEVDKDEIGDLTSGIVVVS